MNENISFDNWLTQLDAVALKNGYTKGIVETAGEECWREYYDEGYSAEEAFIEDETHGI